MVDKKKFEKEGYTITLTSKTIPITDAMEKYIYEKVDKFERFAHIDPQFILKVGAFSEQGSGHSHRDGKEQVGYHPGYIEIGILLWAKEVDYHYW